jgi:hypothetical protein
MNTRQSQGSASMMTTDSGITIGRAYVPAPPRELGAEAERIQSALLKPPPEPIRLIGNPRTVAMFMAALGVCGLFFLGLFLLVRLGR